VLGVVVGMMLEEERTRRKRCVFEKRVSVSGKLASFKREGGISA